MPSEAVIVVVGVTAVFGLFSLLLESASRNY
jgi:hypothetical protein